MQDVSERARGGASRGDVYAVNRQMNSMKRPLHVDFPLRRAGDMEARIFEAVQSLRRREEPWLEAAERIGYTVGITRAFGIIKNAAHLMGVSLCVMHAKCRGYRDGSGTYHPAVVDPVLLPPPRSLSAQTRARMSAARRSRTPQHESHCQ